MRKIGFVVQRYGLEVNGGAEYHCRVLAEKLKAIFEVEVLTTCAKNYLTWENEYVPGNSIVNGIVVRRFPVEKARESVRAYKLGRILRKRSLPQKLLRLFGLLDTYERVFKSKVDMNTISEEWSEAQGPYTPELISYLKENHGSYDALIFFTYLYFPTFQGLRVAPEKSILIPTAHDEPELHMPGFEQVFNLPGAILFNTLAEKNLVHRVFDNAYIYHDIVGVGIDSATGPDDNTQQREFDFRYFIYIGRIDHAKGCAMMIDYFLRYVKLTTESCKLVLIGQQFMEVPVSDNIMSLGYVSESRKLNLLRGAQALIMPSYYESLSLVTLESMKEGTLVIVNEHCEVLQMHVEESHSGLLFKDFATFKLALDSVLHSKVDLPAMKVNGEAYVHDNYDWEVVKRKVSSAVEHIIAVKC